MKQIGEINIKFKNADCGVHYYDVLVRIGEKERRIVLPRYDIMLGWIEIFGFPPQHEWVVLADIKSFSKKATLLIDGEHISEKVDFNLNKKEGVHEIITTREIGTLKEVFTWIEDYTDAPKLIKNSGVFKHNDGTYAYVAEKSIVALEDLERVHKKQKNFVEDIISTHGKPDVLWQKTFTAKGTLPHLFYKMFPIEDSVDLSDMQGSIIEVGYLEKSGEDIDRVHGNWYKLLTIGAERFFIEEGNYAPATIEIDGKKQHIKGTYTKKLFRY